MYFSDFIKQFISILISFFLLSSQITLAVENIQTPPTNPSNLPTPVPTPPIVIDNSIVSHNPTLDKARNNIDIINIATPNDAGISSNYYKEFNVSKSGVIFNNSKDLITSTQLAGFINGNVHLRDKEASLILNQVTGNNISELLGFMEIAGKRADLIIANANGITCDGCGFINSSSATLSTGRIALEEINRLNDLKDFNHHLNVMVQRGHINIEALNSSNIPTLNLIARTLFINKNLLANKLNIILGTNKVGIDLSKNASLLLYEPIEIPNDLNENNSNDLNLNDSSSSDLNQQDKEDKATSKTKTALALDVAYLGSALSHSIYLVATEKGIGVRNSGRIATLASEKEGDGGFIINVNGKVEIAKPREGNTIDDPTDTFIPPSILSSSDLTISAKEVENHSMISAKGNLEIKADTVNNIGSLELETTTISKTPHYEEVGDDNHLRAYDYTTTITEDHLKANTYDPALMMAKNIHIKATNLTNDTAILYAQENTKLKVTNMVNTQPIAKRVEKKVGTTRDYDRLGGECGIWGWIVGDKNNCHSKWYDPVSYTPDPTISSISLSLPSIEPDLIASNIDSLNHQTLLSNPISYTIETNPLYISKDNFISTKTFKSFLHHTFLITHPLADITGMIDGMNKNTQSFIDFKLSNDDNNYLNVNNTMKLNDKNSNTLASSDKTNTSKSKETSSVDSLASSDSNSNDSVDSTSTQTNLTPYQKAQIKALGVYGKDIALISTDAKNSSNIQGNHIAINAKFLLNQNGEIIANNPHTTSPTDSSMNTNVATNTPFSPNNTGDLLISGGVFKNLSSTVKAKNAYLNSDVTEIISGTNSTQGSYSTLTPSNTVGFLGITLKKEPLYTSSKTSLDALSSVNTDNLYVKGEKVTIKGSDINATHHINISADALDISTVKLSDDYADKTQSHSNTTHLASSLKAEDISINVNKDANLTSINLQAKNDIYLSAGGTINFNSATNSLMNQITTTQYSQGNAKNFDFTSTTTTTTTTNTSSTHLANSMVANNIHINSNSSINANNLAINAKGETSINAKDNITLSNLADTFSTDIQTHQKTSGIKFSSEGDNYSISIGKESSDISDKTSANIHQKQTIQASSVSINAGNKASIESSNLIAHNGDISISASDVAISSLKDNFTHQKDETYTSNKIGISVPKSYVNELASSAGKSTLNGLGKGLQWVGEHLDPNNPNNVIVSNHKGLYSIPGKWLTEEADKIKSPYLSEINHLEVGIGFTHTDKNTHHLSSYSQNSSSDLIGNNISINAKNKADIISSNLNANNDINLAAKNLHIASSDNEAISNTSSTSNTFNATLSANIGKDTSINAQASYEHSKNTNSSHQITQASSSLSSKNLYINTSKDTLIEGSSINVTQQSAIKAKSFTFSSKENILHTKESSSSAGGTIKLSYNGSFGGEANGHYDHNDTNTQSLTHTASSFNTGNLSLTTSEDSSIIGSSINANKANIKSQSLNILASKDISNSNSKSNSYSASMTANLSNLSSSKLEGNTYHTSNEKDDSTYNNASLNIDHLTITTQKDLNIIGGNLAVENLKADIAGDMNIESLQDNHKEDHKDFSIEASISSTKTKPSFINSPNSSTTSSVKNQSGINAKNSLQVNVKGDTVLKGAYLNVESKEEHKAPSTLRTNDLFSADITNSSQNKTNRGIKEKNISSTLASISDNIYLEQITKQGTSNTNLHRTSPINEEPKEATLPKEEDSNNKSLFNDLTHQALDLKDVATKVSHLKDKARKSKEAKEANKDSHQSFKEDAKAFYQFIKPLGDSLLDIGWKNTSDALGGFINNTDHQAPKDSFKNAYENTQKQGKEAVNTFMHKVLWE